MLISSHYFTSEPAEVLKEVLDAVPHDRVLAIMPERCAAMLQKHLPPVAPVLDIDDAESAKNIETLTVIFDAMLKTGLTRKSLLINIGGGVTTDMGGLAAALYMRGIRYINVPTTLLAMVDASSGGKTAVDFKGVKNLIGAFHRPLTTIISPVFLHTLSQAQLLSGYGEMIKHDLLRGAALTDIDRLTADDELLLSELRGHVEYKQSVVEADPEEKGLRRILNLGHTAGHAFEAMAVGRGESVTHGQCVAQGLVTALVLSRLYCGLITEVMQRVATLVTSVFPVVWYDCKDYERLLDLMHHDKKNQGKDTIAFTLLKAPGKPEDVVEVTDTQVREALDITRDLLGI